MRKSEGKSAQNLRSRRKFLLSLNDLDADENLPVDALTQRRITELADVIQQCGPLGTGKFVEPRQPFSFFFWLGSHFLELKIGTRKRAIPA